MRALGGLIHKGPADRDARACARFRGALAGAAGSGSERVVARVMGVRVRGRGRSAAARQRRYRGARAAQRKAEGDSHTRSPAAQESRPAPVRAARRSPHEGVHYRPLSLHQEDPLNG